MREKLIEAIINNLEHTNEHWQTAGKAVNSNG